jgi:DNA topoisomerase-1
LDGEKFVREGEKLYELIWKRFVACQMKSAVYDETVIDVEADPKNPKAIRYLLRVSGQIMKFDGWKKLFDGNQNGEVYLPNVDKAEELDLVKVFSEQKFTLPPARFNEASLIKTLEKLGIGRPSTYAPTISTIQLRNYVEKDEGKFRPTTIGNAVNDFLIKNFEKVFDYDFTAGMEAKLDEVAAGEQKWQEMMSDFYKPFAIKLKSVEENAKRVKIETEKLGKKCPKCKEGDLVIRVGRFGKFVSCLRFPDCDYKEKYLEKINMKCPDCKEGEVIVKTTGKGRKFYGCSRYPECKFASWQKPGLSQNNAEVVNENSQERAQKSS